MLVPQGLATGLKPAIAARLHLDAVFDAEFTALLQMALQRGAHQGQVRRVHFLLPGKKQTGKFFVVVTEQFAETSGIIDAAGADVPVPDTSGGTCGRQRIAFFTLSQSQLRLVAFHLRCRTHRKELEHGLQALPVVQRIFTEHCNHADHAPVRGMQRHAHVAVRTQFLQDRVVRKVLPHIAVIITDFAAGHIVTWRADQRAGFVGQHLAICAESQCPHHPVAFGQEH